MKIAIAIKRIVVGEALPRQRFDTTIFCKVRDLLPRH
jgi:hypothetical protein